MDEQPGQDSWGRYSRDKTIGTGPPGQITWTEQRAQNGQNMTARTRLLGQSIRDRTARANKIDRTVRA